MTIAPPPAGTVDRAMPDSFAFIGERLWLDFVNSDAAANDANGSAAGSAERPGARRAVPGDALDSFDGFIAWLAQAGVLDDERAAAMARRAREQPTGASAALHEARRLRNVLRALAERGDTRAARGDRVTGADADDRATRVAINEINRVLGRSAGTRRVELRSDGGFVRNFVTVGDAFAALLTPVIESAADALVKGELERVHRCADPRCARVFFDSSRNGKRRWCEMATCGNRAKAARHRRKLRAT
jgi:predicted RNA-binding Zn ribbon-like protein